MSSRPREADVVKNQACFINTVALEITCAHFQRLFQQGLQLHNVRLCISEQIDQSGFPFASQVPSRCLV